jgi:SulP family sulfate permease
MFGQVPAIALIGIFHLMIGVPFGVSYFPMQWTSHHHDDADDVPSPSSPYTANNGGDYGDVPMGEFPIPGKEAFGIRLFLFSTFIGQVILTFYSGFPNPIGLQMVENIGFTRALSSIAISHQGYGIDTLATIMVMFGIASVLVGGVFYLLGKFQLGKIVYFFPTHVLIGLIGGIGVLLCKTGTEVTIADALSFQSLIDRWELWIVIVGLEMLLRFLERTTTISKGKPKFALLSPVYFCMITPFFYLVLWITRTPVSMANDYGYFFPPLINDGDHEEDSVMSNYGTPWDVWKVKENTDLLFRAFVFPFNDGMQWKYDFLTN